MARNVSDSLTRSLRLLMVMRKVPLQKISARAGSVLRNRYQRYTSMALARSLSRAVIRAIDRLFGPERANSVYWKTPLGSSWESTQSRLFSFLDAGQTALFRSFVRDALLYSPGATYISFLARSAVCRDVVIEGFRDPSFLPLLVMRASKSANYAAGLSAAAAFLLDGADIQHFENQIEPLKLRHTANSAMLIDSFSTTPGASPTPCFGTVASAQSRRRARHRLIIVGRLENPTRLSLLFSDAEKVTLFSPTNLYGRMSFTEETSLHARPAKLEIAHPRSRATRFSKEYHDLHDATHQVAEEVIDEIARRSDGRLEEVLPYLALGLADAIFFEGLKIVGLKALIEDPEIDQVVIVGGEKTDEGLFKALSAIEGLETDPRLELVSLAVSERARQDFVRDFPRLFTQPKLIAQTVSATARPLLPALNDLQNFVVQQPRPYALFPKPTGSEQKARVLFFTRPDSAYNTASSAYAAILVRNFNTMIGVVGSNAATIFDSTPDLPWPPSQRVELLSSSSGQELSLLEQSIQQLLESVASRHQVAGTQPLLAQILLSDSKDIARRNLVAGLLHWERLLHWFSGLRKAGATPDVIVISPLRPTLVGMSAAAARRFGITSLALEPHIINGEYCRYTRVMTDRYGTVSNYLANLAETDFSVPRDRIDIIGSPRLVVQPAASAEVARESLKADNLADFPDGKVTLLFFSQPSNWKQISGVWQIILWAMTKNPAMHLLLKVHPEEDALRVKGFLAIAEEMGLADRVQSVNAPPAILIQAADLVLACYSATLVEAALAGRPVASIISEGQRYPMEQHKVVGSPQYDSVESLAQAFAEFCENPEKSRARLTNFLQENPQFVTGPEQHLCKAIESIVARGTTASLRPKEDLPPNLFIEGPYRVYDV